DAEFNGTNLAAGTGAVDLPDGRIERFVWTKQSTVTAPLLRRSATSVSAMRQSLAGQQTNNTNVMAPAAGASSHVVNMQSSGDTYVVPVTVNGAITLGFVVDSGASDVSVPADVVLTLMRAGTITNNEFLGKKTYELADGSSLPS